MDNKLYVGNLSWNTTEDGLKEYFSKYGTVTSTSIVIDRATNRSKGFGFVEMSSAEEALKARDESNGTEIDGRPIKVDIARPKEDRPRTGGGRPSGGGGGGFRRSNGGGGGRY
jgi:RNA recognition motif-containing protein